MHLQNIVAGVVTAFRSWPGIVITTIIAFLSLYFLVIQPHLATAGSSQELITNARLVLASLENNDQRLLLRCPTESACILTAPLYSDLPFNCPSRKEIKCTATITMSAAHNCVPQNIILANLMIDGNVIPNVGTITEMRLCNPSDANGNFDNLSSYTWVFTGLTSGSHTANILLTYNAVDGTGIGFDHQTLVVNVYASR